MSERATRNARPLRRRGLIAIAATSLLALAGCASTAANDTDATPTPPHSVSANTEQDLHDALQAVVDEYDVPGAVAGVWTANGDAWTTAIGAADIAAGTPASTDMSWPLRSVTKSFTVTLILQLVDEGAISLDDTIDTYVAGVTDGDQITLRELAGMSSGIADYTNDAFLAEFTADPTRVFTLDELNSFSLGQPAQFEPGAQHVYTNANTNLLGAVVESVTGMPFADALDARILEPLALTHTQYLGDGATWTPSHAQGYGPADDGDREPADQNFTIFGPAGAMISTLDDAHIWAEALANGDLIEPATQAEREQGAPLDAGPPYDLYALGIGETDGWWGHNGEGLGFTSAVFHNPDTGVSIVVFMNESNLTDGAHPADRAFRRLAAIMDSE